MRFAAFAVPDAHIDYLLTHPGSVHDYLEGKAPPEVSTATLPEGWPTQPLEDLGSWGLNHRNADLYHWILNGGVELVTGAGSIFQTWYAPDQHAAIKLDALNERFAFRSSQLPELLTRVDQVTVPTVLTAFRAWCESQGQDGSDLDEYACQPFVDEFTNFGMGLKQAISRGHGLVW
jgi:hypothetical protein